MAELKISMSEEMPSNIIIVNIGGIIDASTVPELEKVLTSIVGRESNGVILNFSSVDYISTAGWSSLIKGSQEICSELTVINMSGLADRSFMVMDLESEAHEVRVSIA